MRARFLARVRCGRLTLKAIFLKKFTDFGLAPAILKALETAGYTTPTPIQAQAIPSALEGRDVCGIAQTGTGKTAAFSLPSLHRLALNDTRPARGTCRMLVLSPTRELASQIAEAMMTYSRNLRLSVTTAFGGVPIGRQQRALANGVDVLVATPGRLLDLLEQRSLSLGHVEILVLDEADQMLDLGFMPALKRIVPLLPRKRQSLFFSATMPKTISELAGRFLNDPVQVAVTPIASTAERVEQRVVFVNASEKQALLERLLSASDIERALVFTRTKHGADRVVQRLTRAGIQSAAIHGNKSQAQRERALDDFKKGRTRVLIATDIAARGIDVSGVSHVFNFELPNVAEQYVHRIGRTARAGKSGVAVSLVAGDERAYLKAIERLTKVVPIVDPLPEGFKALVAETAAREPARGEPRPDYRRDPRQGDHRTGRPQQQPRGGYGEQHGQPRPAGGQPKRDNRGGNRARKRFATA